MTEVEVLFRFRKVHWYLWRRSNNVCIFNDVMCLWFMNPLWQFFEGIFWLWNPSWNGKMMSFAKGKTGYLQTIHFRVALMSSLDAPHFSSYGEAWWRWPGSSTSLRQILALGRLLEILKLHWAAHPVLTAAHLEAENPNRFHLGDPSFSGKKGTKKNKWW